MIKFVTSSPYSSLISKSPAASRSCCLFWDRFSQLLTDLRWLMTLPFLAAFIPSYNQLADLADPLIWEGPLDYPRGRLSYSLLLGFLLKLPKKPMEHDGMNGLWLGAKGYPDQRPKASQSKRPLGKSKDLNKKTLKKPKPNGFWFGKNP